MKRIIIPILTCLCCAACDDSIDPIVTSIGADRLFSPINLEVQVINQTSARLRWEEVAGAKAYNIQFFLKSGSDSTLAKSFNDIDFTAMPYTVPGFEGETDYTVCIQATGDIAASKWTAGSFKTGTEQIFQTVNPDEIQATQVTLRWTAGERATEITLTPGDIRHTVTADEIAAGAATITGLTGETEYTARLMNGVKTRGVITFTTLIDLGGAKRIDPGDDLAAILDAAAEGDAFVIFPGEYIIGAYEVTKSVKLSGYKTNDKPVIKGQLTCKSAVASIELKSLKFVGNNDPASILAQPFNATAAGCDIKSLIFNDCDISDYSNGLIYNNVSAKFGDIEITNSLIHDIPGSGGDGIDFRGGTLGSLTVTNTTFYNCFRTFLRMQATAGPISFSYCTFYKTAYYDNSNNHGMFRITSGASFAVKNCLFVETGNAASTVTTAGNFCRQASNMSVQATDYQKNYYYNCSRLWEGLYTNPTQCDARESNPLFADPANGNFKVGGDDIKGVAGDPRWW